jgi:hypothetical protein
MVCAWFVIIGVLLLVGGIREWQIESASVNWPSTQAEITHSEVARDIAPPTRFGIGFALNMRQISVSYQVNGARYTADFKISADTVSTSPRNPAHDMFSSPAKVEHLTVYYDPENPRMVVLYPGDQSIALRGVIGGSMAIIIPSMFILLLGSLLSKSVANS